MRDVIFTIIAVWVVYRIFSSMNASRNSNTNMPKEGETTINSTASSKKKNHNNNDEGEYVDYEEIK